MIMGLLKNKHYAPAEIACMCGSDSTGPQLASRSGILYQPDIAELLTQTDVVVLACKPQQLNDLPAELAQLTAGKLMVSILAGTTLTKLKTKFRAARNIVRAMPNTPGQIGAGITAYAPVATLDAADGTAVNNILGSLGTHLELTEDKIDAVTAISGSGPAYVFEFAAALREAARSLDLEPAIAQKLALQTLYGAAKLLEATGDDPEALRDQVTSPGGTTQAALESLASNNLRAIITAAATAARDRSVELATI